MNKTNGWIISIIVIILALFLAFKIINQSEDNIDIIKEIPNVVQPKELPEEDIFDKDIAIYRLHDKDLKSVNKEWIPLNGRIAVVNDDPMVRYVWFQQRYTDSEGNLHLYYLRGGLIPSGQGRILETNGQVGDIRIQCLFKYCRTDVYVDEYAEI